MLNSSIFSVISLGSRRAGSQAEPGLSAVSAPQETLSNLPWLCLYHVPTRYVHLPGITHSGSVAGLKIPRSCTKAPDSCQYGHLKPVCPQRRWASGRQHQPCSSTSVPDPASASRNEPEGTDTGQPHTQCSPGSHPNVTAQQLRCASHPAPSKRTWPPYPHFPERNQSRLGTSHKPSQEELLALMSYVAGTRSGKRRRCPSSEMGRRGDRSYCR